ncbi:hypothetical protein F5X96DRAFT_26808 [Biscogniauxia mediterranea]|nr:hypothetical protein F5X96DRAFT_26808 [Biscogniauxia mediterranea]
MIAQISVDKLRPLLPQLMRRLHNHGHAKFRSTFQSSARHTSGRRLGLMINSCGMSSIARPLKEMTTADISSAGKTGESHLVLATSGDDEAEKVTTERKVAILWDLDNKQPLALPEDVAQSIRTLADGRGKIIEYSAMANVNAFVGLPPAAMTLKQDRARLLAAEKRGEYTPAEPCVCPLCGNKFATNVKLKKHYERLHERELRKRLVMSNHFKGKKKERLVKKLEKRHKAHTEIMAPEREHKVYRSLKRAGVLVRIVAKTSQAADNALRHRYTNLKKNSDLTLILISDDSDFYKMAQNAKKHGVHVIVIGENPNGKLAKIADEWISWENFNDNAWIQM